MLIFYVPACHVGCKKAGAHLFHSRAELGTVIWRKAKYPTAAGRHRGEIAKAISAARLRVKDPASARALDADILEAAEHLEHNSALAMAAMLLVSERARNPARTLLASAVALAIPFAARLTLLAARTQ